ncbi:MAG: glycoside hydrolase family 2 protein [Oscillospiraceae bacterium]|nr:glycoside hydrolase family 2 protein [Oscillospiraceae bacterium]
MELKNWIMTYEGYPDLSCQVPCSLYSTLLEHGLMEDPYYGLNEHKYTGLSEKDCTFTCSFEVGEELTHDYVCLTFCGLDTLCTIWLNGKKLDSARDMHRTYSYEVKSLLLPGVNTLKLHFASPIRYMAQEQNKNYLWNNEDSVDGVAHLRKSMCMSGWDWGPKLPDMGIFRKAELVAYDTDAICDVQILQYHEEGKVRLTIKAETKHHADAELFAEVDGKRVALKDGEGELIIENPRLWWVRGYGDQPLYDVAVTLEKDGTLLDKAVKRIGLRTLTVSTKADKVGREFCFVVNGVKIFAMGADYIPEDSILKRVTAERSRKLLEDCVAANFNCLRVWGGGYYPDDWFFDACDELGILVWQDFMSACFPIRLSESFREDFTREAIDNVKRLRHHPSLGLLCGNNELEANLAHNPDLFGSERIHMDYMELFERILPDVCEKYAPQIFYWPSSPSSGGGLFKIDDETMGDCHYWDIWFSNMPFAEVRKHKIRFCSEYGFQAYPAMKTIRSFAEEEDLNCYSRVFENHQKSRAGNSLLMNHLSRYYLAPYSMEQLVYATQLLQAEAMRCGVEYFRSIRGTCMGSLYWQLNDCWPVASWSSIDYYGRWKGLHYAAKKFHAPVALCVFLEEGHLRVCLANETMKIFAGKLKVRLVTSDLQELDSWQCDVCGDALSATDVFEKSFAPEEPYSTFISVELYDEADVCIARRSETFIAPKHFSFKKPSVQVRFEKEREKTVAYVSADVYCKDVYLDFEDFDCIFSDNFFDLTDQKEYKLELDTDRDLQQLQSSLQIMTVYDIGR